MAKVVKIAKSPRPPIYPEQYEELHGMELVKAVLFYYRPGGFTRPMPDDAILGQLSEHEYALISYLAERSVNRGWHYPALWTEFSVNEGSNTSHSAWLHAQWRLEKRGFLTIHYNHDGIRDNDVFELQFEAMEEVFQAWRKEQKELAAEEQEAS